MWVAVKLKILVSGCSRPILWAAPTPQPVSILPSPALPRRLPQRLEPRPCAGGVPAVLLQEVMAAPDLEDKPS